MFLLPYWAPFHVSSVQEYLRVNHLKTACQGFHKHALIDRVLFLPSSSLLQDCGTMKFVEKPLSFDIRRHL